MELVGLNNNNPLGENSNTLRLYQNLIINNMIILYVGHLKLQILSMITTYFYEIMKKNGLYIYRF